MVEFGQFCLLAAFVASGFASFASLAGCHETSPRLRKSAVISAIFSVLLLTLVVLILAVALVTKDFRFAYVAQYCNKLLPWRYALSAFWVGQAGSLLLWAWFLALLALGFRVLPRKRIDPLREAAFGLLMAFFCFLIATMVFAADPMARAIGTPREGTGLSPLLQHPAMLIHPPIVFLGYAAWTVPCALALSALSLGRLDAQWVHQARPWAVFAWAVLGVGILEGAQWAYEELGWGGYWGWDPVENGSLIPWLTGTAFMHTLMTWRQRGVMKKSAVVLAIATFAMCNFATFLTRSGIFSSLHAFSQSPIGWLFLAVMTTLTLSGGYLVFLRRAELAPDRPISAVFSREGMIMASSAALLVLAFVICLGTLCGALSDAVIGRKIVVGPPFYNNVLAPTGLLVLAATALAPILRWGAPPRPAQRNALLASVVVGGMAVACALACGVQNLVALSVIGIVGFAVAALIGAVLLDAKQGGNYANFAASLLHRLRYKRRLYAGFLVHLGFFGLAIGIVASSLGTRRHEVELQKGQTTTWAGRSITLVEMIDRELPDKLIAEAKLNITSQGVNSYTLLPAQHLHRLQNEWTTEVAVKSGWDGDFYVILHGSSDEGGASLTLVENPMMRWFWLGGITMLLGTVVALWPQHRSDKQQRSFQLPTRYASNDLAQRSHSTSQVADRPTETLPNQPVRKQLSHVDEPVAA